MLIASIVLFVLGLLWIAAVLAIALYPYTFRGADGWNALIGLVMFFWWGLLPGVVVAAIGAGLFIGWWFTR
jgi:hypothetical protein